MQLLTFMVMVAIRLELLLPPKIANESLNLNFLDVIHVLNVKDLFVGIDSIAADLKDQKITVIGEMDALAVAKKLKKLGKLDIVSVGPAKEEKKEVKKDGKK